MSASLSWVGQSTTLPGCNENNSVWRLPSCKHRQNRHCNFELVSSLLLLFTNEVSIVHTEHSPWEGPHGEAGSPTPPAGQTSSTKSSPSSTLSRQSSISSSSSSPSPSPLSPSCSASPGQPQWNNFAPTNPRPHHPWSCEPRKSKVNTVELEFRMNSVCQKYPSQSTQSHFVDLVTVPVKSHGAQW